ncbi:SGNH/GDSL hydrolase family protein [Methylobacterium sp. ID0610]|uniref:SGNH/GDSL hydrolase family protein n=1 Tax=Methylobacterium carpenticola TaxID=3344827 RepID=UPI0036809D28
MTHAVLLGDSVFDNGAYVRGGPDVVRQLRPLLPGGHATLLAVDGAVLTDVPRQLARLPAEATHLVVSAGGNDALRASGVLDGPARSVTEVLDALATAQDRFRADYRAMLDAVLAHGRPTAICTIYEPRYPDPARRRVAATALAVLNDAVTREAAARGLALLDLRVLCDEDADFANPIEPSVRGGEKIAATIAAFLREAAGQSRGLVFVRP